jgi:transposase-like protein
MEKLAIKIPVSLGELVDKITILRIKQACITDAVKIANVSREYHMLVAIPEYSTVKHMIASHEADLQKVNQLIWTHSEDIRQFDQENDISDEYLETFRIIFKLNDERSRIKKVINVMCNSELVEEKSFE